MTVNAYDSIACPLDGCRADLYVVHTSNAPICVGSTVEDLRGPINAIITTWQVECTEGHVLVLPKDGGEGGAFDEDPENRDAERVAALTGWRVQREGKES